MPSVIQTRVAMPLTPPQVVPTATGLLTVPSVETPRATVVLAHGAGSGPESDVLTRVAHALAESGAAVLRFAFAYRAIGRRAPDPAARLLSAWRDALAFAAQVGPAPLVIGGRSMGGRMASLLAAEGAACDGLLLLAYPLVGRSGGTPRTEHWPSLTVPALFVSGTRDTMCDLDLLNRERRALAGPSQLAVLAGADHSFDVRVRDGRTRAQVLTEVADAATGFVTDRVLETTSAGAHR